MNEVDEPTYLFVWGEIDDAYVWMLVVLSMLVVYELQVCQLEGY